MLMSRRLPAATVPATTVIASMTAALQVNEALAWMHGRSRLQSGEMVMISLSPYSLSTCTMDAREDCLAHEDYSPSCFMDALPAELTVGGLLARIPGAISLQLDFDVLEGWLCVNCGPQFTAGRLSKTAASQIECPQCGAQRSPQLTHEIGASDRLASHSLADLGVPVRSILRVRTVSGTCCVELFTAKGAKDAKVTK